MRWKLYLSLVLLALVLTFVLQNTEAVSFRFLFWTFGLPRALMLLVVFIGGVATGLLWIASRGRNFIRTGESKRKAGRETSQTEERNETDG